MTILARFAYHEYESLSTETLNPTNMIHLINSFIWKKIQYEEQLYIVNKPTHTLTRNNNSNTTIIR